MNDLGKTISALQDRLAECESFIAVLEREIPLMDPAGQGRKDRERILEEYRQRQERLRARIEELLPF